MTQNDWQPVSLALLFSWPSQVNSWGDAVLAGYCSRLEHLGVTPDQALAAIDSCGADQTHPPSAPELAGLARNDPGAPTFDELVHALYATGGVIRPLWSYPGDKGMPVAADRLAGQHAHIQAFVRSVGLAWLRSIDPREGEHEYAGADRRKLAASWREFLERADERKVAALAAGGDRARKRLRAFDPSTAITGEGFRQIEA